MAGSEYRRRRDRFLFSHSRCEENDVCEDAFAPRGGESGRAGYFSSLLARLNFLQTKPAEAGIYFGE